MVPIVFLFVFPFGSAATVKPKSKAKVVEDYVVSANFDNVPQTRGLYEEEMGIDRKITNVPGSYFHNRDNDDKPTGYGMYHEDMRDRDFVLPGHAPHHHPPPPPPPAVISPHALFAMGFMNFLILLSVMQAALAVMSKNPQSLGAGGGLFGGALGNPHGRQKRYIFLGPLNAASAVENAAF